MTDTAQLIEVSEVALVVLVAAALLRWHLWRAVIFLAPSSVRIEADSPPGMASIPSALEATHDAFVALGFEHLGTHFEHPRFGRRVLHFDYVHREKQVFAAVHAGLEGQALFTLLTPTHGGGSALTASFRRPCRDLKGRYVSGGLEGAAPERLLKAHLRRVPEAGTPEADWSLEGRVAAARAWYAGTGKGEVRQQNAVGLLWTLGALGMVGAAFFGRSG